MGSWHLRVLAWLAIVTAAAVAAACTRHDGSPHTVDAPPPEIARTPASEPLPPAASAPPVAPAAPSAPVDVGSDDWPSLPYAAFVPDETDQAHRRAAWLAFHAAEREARTFAPGRWIPVIRTEFSRPGNRNAADWTTRGVIQVQHGYKAETLFHEVFHPAFHNSEFHTSKTDRDGLWAEAFCNAFRYYAERELLPAPTHWVDKFDRIATMTEKEGLGVGDHRMRYYVYPAALIIKRVGGPKGSMAALRTLWFSLVAKRIQRGGPVLDEFFGYSPSGAGAPAAPPAPPGEDDLQ